MAGRLIELVKGSGSLLLIVLLLTGSRCNDEKDPEFVFITFEIPLTIRPGNETIRIGDSLWLVGNFPDTLRDIRSGNYYRLKEFDFQSKICLKRITNNQLYLSEQTPAFEEFYYLGGTNQISSICGTFKISYSSNGYSYSVGFIPKNTGIFTLSINRPVAISGMPEDRIDFRPFLDLGISNDGRKRIPVYEAFLFIINDGNTNFDLYKQYVRQGTDIVPSEELGTFTFRVIE